jgi:hypothetical protein
MIIVENPVYHVSWHLEVMMCIYHLCADLDVGHTNCEKNEFPIPVDICY